MALITQIKGDDKAKSSPVIKRNIELNSLQAQKVITRSFEKLAESLFTISVILRAVGEREHVDEAENLINGHFEAVTADLNEKLEQLRELVQQNGIAVSPDYTNAVVFSIEINTPHLGRFAGLVTQLDELITLIDALWLNAVFDSRQASNAKYEWRQRLIRVAGKIIGMAKRVRTEAYQNGKQEIVDKVAPATSDDDMDAELKKAVEEPDTDVKAAKQPAKEKKVA